MNKFAFHLLVLNLIKISTNAYSVHCVTILMVSLFYSSERVRVHLEDYFERSQSCHIVEVDHLSMLCIQCFEVSNTSRSAKAK